MQPGLRHWTARLPLGGPLGRSEPDLLHELLATPMEPDHESWFGAQRSTSSVREGRALVAPTPSAGGWRPARLAAARRLGSMLKMEYAFARLPLDVHNMVEKRDEILGVPSAS